MDLAAGLVVTLYPPTMTLANSSPVRRWGSSRRSRRLRSPMTAIALIQPWCSSKTTASDWRVLRPRISITRASPTRVRRVRRRTRSAYCVATFSTIFLTTGVTCVSDASRRRRSASFVRLASSLPIRLEHCAISEDADARRTVSRDAFDDRPRRGGRHHSNLRPGVELLPLQYVSDPRRATRWVAGPRARADEIAHGIGIVDQAAPDARIACF